MQEQLKPKAGKNIRKKFVGGNKRSSILLIFTGLPTKDEIVKATWNFKDMMIPKSSSSDKVMKWVPILFGKEIHNFSCRESWVCGNRQYKFTISSLKSYPEWVTLYYLCKRHPPPSSLFIFECTRISIISWSCMIALA